MHRGSYNFVRAAGEVDLEWEKNSTPHQNVLFSVLGSVQ